MVPAAPQGAQPSRAVAYAAAGSIRFTPVGPFGLAGKLNALAVDPANPKVLYVAGGRGAGLESYSSAGIFKTTDGGRTWRPIDRGLTDPAGVISSVVNALWLDPANPSTLVAATEYDGLFRTIDGGATWTSVYGSGRASSIVAYGGALYAALSEGIVVSFDDGATWHLEWRATASQQPAALGAAQGSAGSAIFAGMSDGSIFTLSGSAWIELSKLPYDAHSGNGEATPAVHQIAVDPFAPQTVYASTNDGLWNQDLHASVDGGRTWTTIDKRHTYLFGLGSQAIAFSAVHPHRLYVGGDGAMGWIVANGSATPHRHRAVHEFGDNRDIWVVPNGADDACYITADQGLEYFPACSKYTKRYAFSYLSGGTSSGLARRFVVAANGKTITASLQDYSDVSTADGGKSWFYNPGGLYEDGFNEQRPGDPNFCYSYDEIWGLRSSQGCLKYARTNIYTKKPLPSRLMTAPLAFDPKNPAHMYLASGPTNTIGVLPPAPKAAYESTDGGKTLHQLKWPAQWPGAIVVDSANGSHIVVGDLRTSGSALLATFDGGKTWTRSTGVPATPFWYSVAISPANGNTVLASSVDASNNVFVLRSTDGGKTFRSLGTVVNAPVVRMRAGTERETEYFNYSPQHDLRYNQDVTKGSPAVVITTLRGAYLSTDDGSAWQRLDSGTIAHSFWGIRWVNGYLYLGSDGQGILRSTLPVQKP